jgi:hypothetical protein
MAGRSTAIRGKTDGLRTFTKRDGLAMGFRTTAHRDSGSVTGAVVRTLQVTGTSGVHRIPHVPEPRRHDLHWRRGPCGGRLWVGKVFFTRAAVVGATRFRPVSAVHVTAGHNARRGIRSRSIPRIRPCWRNEHRSVLWPKWVVLIAGSTGSALRAVRPFQPSRRAGPDAISPELSSLSVAPPASFPSIGVLTIFPSRYLRRNCFAVDRCQPHVPRRGKC